MNGCEMCYKPIPDKTETFCVTCGKWLTYQSSLTEDEWKRETEMMDEYGGGEDDD